jgi:hypothetical protein
MKNNQAFCPMRPLHAVLIARFGSRPAGCWVVFQTAIADAKVFALACAWSQRGISCFLSACGKTTLHVSKCMTHCEDDFGNVVHKAISRPAICHFLCEHLPLIDEHDKQRQNLLNLKRCWCTKDPWMRLLTTLGMCVVDMHRLHRNTKCDEQRDKWITREGSATRDPTDKQMKKESQLVGSAHKANCFICCKHLKRNGTVECPLATWQCKTCQMPLCKQSCIGAETGRTDMCVSMHQQSADHVEGCIGMHSPCSAALPKELHVNVHPRRSS